MYPTLAEFTRVYGFVQEEIEHQNMIGIDFDDEYQTQRIRLAKFLQTRAGRHNCANVGFTR